MRDLCDIVDQRINVGAKMRKLQLTIPVGRAVRVLCGCQPPSSEGRASSTQTPRKFVRPLRHPTGCDHGVGATPLVWPHARWGPNYIVSHHNTVQIRALDSSEPLLPLYID